MEWFKHDANASLDDKLQMVLLDYGLEGYGLYWYCVELIVNKVSKDNITFQLKHDARIIARNTGSTLQKVEEMMKRFVELGLFENDGGTITCMKVAKRLVASATSNPTMRKMIHDVNENKVLAAPSQHRHDDVMQDKIRREEKRTDKIRKEKPITQTSLLDDGFLEFWNLFPKKVGVSAAKKSWEKLKPPIDEVIAALKWKKTSEQWNRSNGQFIPNPATYLNQGRWKDEPVKEELPF